MAAHHGTFAHLAAATPDYPPVGHNARCFCRTSDISYGPACFAVTAEKFYITESNDERSRTRRGPAAPLTGLPALDVSAAEARRARELAARHGMLREQDVDLADPVIARVERFAAERDRPAVTDEYRSLSYGELAAGPGAWPRSWSGRASSPARWSASAASGARRSSPRSSRSSWSAPSTSRPTRPGRAGRVRDVLDQAGASVLVTVDAGATAPALLEGAAGRLPRRARRRAEGLAPGRAGRG